MSEVAGAHTAAAFSLQPTAASESTIEFIVDPHAQPGDLLEPLARLLLSLARKERKAQ